LRYDLLITDLDGTLVDLGIDWDQLRDRIRREMGWNHPLKPLGPSIPVAAGGDREKIEAAFKIVEIAEIEAAMRAERDEKLASSLERLRGFGLRIGLVTLQALKPAITALRRLGVLEFFDVIVTREISLSREEQLRLAIEKLRGTPERSIFVGDTEMDLESSRRIGCLFVSVGRRVSWRFSAESFYQVPDLVEAIMVEQDKFDH